MRVRHALEIDLFAVQPAVAVVERVHDSETFDLERRTQPEQGTATGERRDVLQE